jgi:hypothetical protein
MTIEEAVKNTRLKGFEEYDLQSLIFFSSEFDRIQNDSKKHSFVYYALRCFVDRYKWKYEKGEAKILFFMHITDRQDCINSINSVSNLVQGRNYIFLEKNNRPFLLRNGIRLFLFLISWIASIKKMNLNAKQKSRLIIDLIRLKRLDFFLDKVDIGSHKLAVVFYDAHPFGNLVVQKYKRLGIKTATLSHGIVLAKRDENVLDYSGIELRGSISDFFLIWNKLSYDEAIKQGISTEKLRIVGISKCMDAPIIEKKNQNRIFGILLDNQSGDEFNKELIKIANTLAELLEYKFTIRFHPSFKGFEYDDIIDFKSYLGKNLDVSLYNYAQKIEFSILANSTALIELVYMKHVSYRYSTNDLYDKYKELPYNAFEGVYDLLRIIKEERDESQMLFERLCTIEDIKSSYKNFFKDFLE